MNNIRYYKPTVGSDFIPDRFAWIDRATPWVIFGMGAAMWVATLWRMLS